MVGGASDLVDIASNMVGVDVASDMVVVLLIALEPEAMVVNQRD